MMALAIASYVGPLAADRGVAGLTAQGNQIRLLVRLATLTCAIATVATLWAGDALFGRIFGQVGTHIAGIAAILLLFRTLAYAAGTAGPVLPLIGAARTSLVFALVNTALVAVLGIGFGSMMPIFGVAIGFGIAFVGSAAAVTIYLKREYGIALSAW
jgi:O-antigen/teichoic acid export membrane protein